MRPRYPMTRAWSDAPVLREFRWVIPDRGLARPPCVSVYKLAPAAEARQDSSKGRALVR